ncbi:MAG: 3-oxoacyl-ACP reductase FabG [Desulfobacteraceae bacterium]|nr:3-oxoacyl-ACP reductase FabG [Desulfobacteraceae bacterium]
MRFQEKTAIITGGAKGIGRAVAEVLVSEGASVIISDMDMESTSVAANEIKESIGGQVVPFKADVREKGDILSLVESTLKEFGRVDILFNNAGICTSPPIEEISEEEWDEMMDVNLRGVFFCSQAVMSVMKEQGQGRILNMASLAGKTGGLAAGAHYSASKAGVICLTKTFARTLAPYGVTVNALAPGPVETDMLQTLQLDQMEFTLEQCPLGRFADTADVVGAALFLLSDSARHITGTTLNLNGGLLME